MPRQNLTARGYAGSRYLGDVTVLVDIGDARDLDEVVEQLQVKWNRVGRGIRVEFRDGRKILKEVSRG